MKKQKRFTRQISDGFLARKALTYWRNLIVNFDENVGDSDFFEYFGRCDAAGETIKRVRALYKKEKLDEIGYGISRHVASGNVADVLHELWNDRCCRVKARELVLSVTDILLTEVKDGAKGETETRIDYVAKVFGFGEVEKEILTFVFVSDLYRMKSPDHVYSLERTKHALFVAMATDLPFEDVRKALDAKSKLFKFNCIDTDLQLVHDPVGDYIAGSDNEALEGKFYAKSSEEPLPWSYFGELAEKEGVVLKRLLTSGDGQGGMNILLYGAPGTGKTSFARTVVREAGLNSYEIRQNESDARTISSENRIVGIQLCNEQLPPKGNVVIVDEADEILRTNVFNFSKLFGMASAQGSEKGVVNTLLDGVRMPTIWIVNTTAEAMDPSVRRRFDYSICFNALSLSQRLAIWRNSVEKFKVGNLIGEALIRDFAKQYETSAGGIAVVVRNVAKLRPAKKDVLKTMTDLMEPHCALVGVRRMRDSDLVVDGYSLDGLNIKNGMPISRIAEIVREFYKVNDGEIDKRRPRLNILLWGPPGAGKTEFVKYLAEKSGHKVKTLMGSDLLSCWVGGTEKNIARAFREAQDEKSILFLDEIDGMVQSRGRADHTWEVSQVNELLHCMENFNGVLVGATNFFDNLDQAIMRRFTFKVRFDFLENDGKVKLFERIFGTKLTAGDRKLLEEVESVTPGDMAVVRQNLYYLGTKTSNADRIAALAAEIESKRIYLPRAIGFGK